MKMLKQMMTLASVTSCVSGGFQARKLRACYDGDEGGDVENVSQHSLTQAQAQAHSLVGYLKLHYVRSNPASNLIGRVTLPAEMGWLSPPRGHWPLRDCGPFRALGHTVQSVHIPNQVYQLDLGSSQLNYHASFGSSIQTNTERKLNNVFVVPKSVKGLNSDSKTPSFTL